MTLRAVRVLSIVHERDVASGVFAYAAAARGDELVEWIPAELPAPPPNGFGAMLVLGGAMHLDEEQEHAWLRSEKELLREFLARGTPALGVCLGAQLLAEVAGGRVARSARPEIGWTPVEVTPAAAGDALLARVPPRFESFQWHSYEVYAPPTAVALARSARCLQAFRLGEAPWWGIQFHAEATAETIAGWIADYRSDADAVRARLDWGAMITETHRKIAPWNELGIGICRRFLGHAEAAS